VDAGADGAAGDVGGAPVAAAGVVGVVGVAGAAGVLAVVESGLPMGSTVVVAEARLVEGPIVVAGDNDFLDPLHPPATITRDTATGRTRAGNRMDPTVQADLAC